MFFTFFEEMFSTNENARMEKTRVVKISHTP